MTFTVFFSGFFRRIRRLTRRNSELDEILAELDKKLFELGQKSGELDLDFYLKSSLTKILSLKSRFIA